MLILFFEFLRLTKVTEFEFNPFSNYLQLKGILAPPQPHTGKLFQSPTAKASAYALYVRLSWALLQT